MIFLFSISKSGKKREAPVALFYKDEKISLSSHVQQSTKIRADNPNPTLYLANKERARPSNENFGAEINKNRSLLNWSSVAAHCVLFNMASSTFNHQSSLFLNWFKGLPGATFHSDIEIADLRDRNAGRGIGSLTNYRRELERCFASTFRICG